MSETPEVWLKLKAEAGEPINEFVERLSELTGSVGLPVFGFFNGTYVEMTRMTTIAQAISAYFKAREQ